MSAFDYHRPTSLAEAWRLKAECPEARYVAGGTDMMVCIRAGTERPPALISLRGIEELSGIESGETTRIGALTTITDILEHPVLGETYPVLLDAARPFAGVQIRNMASIGGNICNASPGADLPPALLVLEASVHIAGPAGAREMPLDDFFVGPGETCLGPDEVLTAIVLDPPPAGARACCIRKGRVQMDLALVSVAVLLVMDGDRCTRARVAVGAVAPRPLRLRAVEGLLEGRRMGADVLAEARALAEREVSPITDVRASADYRRQLTGALFRRTVESARGGERT